MIMSLAESKILHGTQRRRATGTMMSLPAQVGCICSTDLPARKTLCVESLARFWKPLYSISFAEFGASTAELEERLSVTLQLAARWDA